MKTLRSLLTIVLFGAADLLGAPDAINLRSASQPLDEGVPEVAVGRLQQVLRNKIAPEE